MEFFIVFTFIVGAVGLIAFSVFLLITVFSQRQRIKNAPVITVPATIVSKRTNTSGGVFGEFSTGEGGATTSVFGFTGTDCFATFQFENGDRVEFGIEQNKYGLLAEKDIGILTYQDIKFISFERERV